MSNARKARPARADELTVAEQHFLFGADRPPDADSADWWSLSHDSDVFRPGRPTVAELWARYGAEVVRAWIDKRPGSRPPLWRRYSAPEPQRRRVGGIGTAAHECTACVLRLHRGLPVDWLTPDLAKTIGAKAASVRADKPPLFESEAAYLRRHGLLTGAESRALQASAYAPVPIF